MTEPTEETVIFPTVRARPHIPEYVIYFAMSLLFLAHAAYTTASAVKSYSTPELTELTRPISNALKTIHAAKFVCTQLNGKPQAYLSTYDANFPLIEPASSGIDTLPALSTACPTKFQLTVPEDGPAQIAYSPGGASLTELNQEWDTVGAVVRSGQVAQIAAYLLQHKEYFSNHNSDGTSSFRPPR